MNKLYNRFRGRCLPVLLFLMLMAGVATAQQAQIQKGVLRIKIKEAFGAKLEQSSNGRVVADAKSTGIKSLNALNASYKATSMKRVFPDAGKYEARHRKHGLHLWYEVQIDSTAPAAKARADYRAIPEIEIAEPVHKKAILDYTRTKDRIYLPPVKTASAASRPGGPMNDPMLERQWHYNNHGQTFGKAGTDIDLLKAWSIETGSRDVIVAIVDGGVQSDHPDLKANMWTNDREIPDNGKDDDNNGFVDDIHGFSFVDWRGAIKPHPHGTHVAGTVAAVNNNGIGVSGVAGGSGNGDGVRLMSCAVFKFLTPQTEIGGGFENAYIYAADNGAVISQNSWGYDEFGAYDQVVLDAIDYFVAEAGQDENGVQTGPMKGGIVIFSAGNDGNDGMKYPAYYDKTLSVAALTHRNIKAYYSNYGNWVDIAAPGGELGFNPDEEGILSTYIGGEYRYSAGTSMAAPHVSGAAALVVSHFGGKDFTADMLRKKLISSTDDVNNDNVDYAGMLGTGRLNAFAALQGENDLAGPQAIADLTVKSISENALTLQWTAPTDAGSNSATAYEIRYATTPITPANFAEAIYVGVQPRPGPAGATETFTVPELELNTKYYVAMLAYDMFRNVSPLSNVVQATTQPAVKDPAPVITINPFPLELQLKPIDSVVKKVYITNRGNKELKYTIERNEGFGMLEETYHMLTFSKRAGTVAPGKSDTLLLTFEPFEVSYWIYEEFTITSNDPVNGKVAWPVQVNFTETKGKPVFTATQLDLGKTMVGTNSRKTVSLKSKGSKNVQLLKYSFDNPDFSAFIGDFYPQSNYSTVPLENYDSVTFNVFFRPSATGKTTGTLTIRTDDPEYPVLTLPLSGEGLPAPAAAVDTDTLSAAINTGETVTRKMTLRNTGTAEMTYHVLEEALPAEPAKVLMISPDASGIAMPFLLADFKEITVDVADRIKDLTVAQLLPYDVVMVMNLQTWENGADITPEKMGNLLADYIDAGGKVIVNQFAYYGFENYAFKTGLQGRFITENYGPFVGDETPYIPRQILGEVLIPKHPLMKGVHELSYDGALQRVKLSPGAAGIARWNSGEWVLAANHNVIGMNFMPFGQRSVDKPTTGDLKNLYRNAIHWLAGSNNLNVQPASGRIPAGGAVELTVQINANQLATGLYSTALGIATNDPYHGQLIVPVGIQVQGPSFLLAPEAVLLSAGIGEKTTQTAKLRNDGTLAFPYNVSIQNSINRSTTAIDSTTSRYFSTGFAGFNTGRLTNHPHWLDSGKWYIDTVAAYSGKHHLRYTSNGMSNPARLISPAIERGTGLSYGSAAIMIEGRGTAFTVSPVSTPSNFPVTSVTFEGDGTARVNVYDESTQSFDTKRITEVIPNGYFNLSFDLDAATSEFHVYYNQKLVFTGTSPLQTINAMSFESDNKGSGQNFYIDNVMVRQGEATLLPEFLSVSPATGVLQPGEEATLTVQADTHGLDAGTYGASLVAGIGEGIAQANVPVTLQVTGAKSNMKVSHQDLQAWVDHNTTATRFFEITNLGGAPFDFTAEVPAADASWISVQPASATVPPGSIVVVRVNYSSKTLAAGSYASTITIAGNAANQKTGSITTSLEVREPAVLFFGPAIIDMELVAGNEIVVPIAFTNGGNSALQVIVEETTKDWIRIDGVKSSLRPKGGQVIVPVSLKALQAGMYNYIIEARTSDPEKSLVYVPVQLKVMAAPKLQMPTDTLRVTAAPGAQTNQRIDIANAGETELNYLVNTRSISEITPLHGGPDEFGYTFVKTGEPGGPAFAWNDISETGIPLYLGDCDSATVALPFAFPFYGVAQHEVKIVADGYLTFGNTGLPTRNANDRGLLNPTSPNNFIAAHWDDLDQRIYGTIHYKQESDKLIVQYSNVAINSWGRPTEPALQNTFQTVLHADGSIAFHYLDIMASPQQLAGIENANATDGLLVKDVWDWNSRDSVTFLIVPTVPWLNVDTQAGVLTGGAQNQLNVQFDATGLEEGVYPATIFITSNDRRNPVTRIPVKMDTKLTTDVVPEAAKAIFSVYPVPTADRLNVRLNRKVNRGVALTILNPLGQKVFEKALNEREISDYALDLVPLHLAPGVYSIQLASQDGWLAARSFVKQ